MKEFLNLEFLNPLTLNLACHGVAEGEDGSEATKEVIFMKYICSGLIIVMMLVVAPGFAASEKGNNYPPVVEPDSSGEGVIERIADENIVINDTLLTFSSSPILQYENGDYLSRSSLKKGDEVLYHVNSRLEIILLIVDKK